MSALEVLKTCPTQRKALFSVIGVIDPSYPRLINFDLDQGEPQMPSFVAFQVPVMIQNLVIHRFIIDEGESTYVMSTFVWYKLGSPTLQPSSTSLPAYDGCFSQPQGVFTNLPIDLSKKIVLIDIEVVNAQINCNVLLGRSYKYAMRAIASTEF